MPCPCNCLGDHTTELQRSMEFEDSLTLLCSNKKGSFKQSKAAYNTFSPGRRPRALNDLITIFEATKSAQGVLCVSV